MQKFNVSLSPAEASPDSLLGFSMKLCDPASREFEIEATTADEVEAKVRDLVKNDFKRPASAYVAPLRGARKPRGFDAMARRIHFIPHEPEVVETAAAG